MEMTLANNASGCGVVRNEMVRADEDVRQMLGAQLLRLTQWD